ncbi:DUF4270 domain-containing protein [Emticicia fluvialis]|uniref:DUF4270 domain-containing protein n=1 Tax=Emticicia fluvialis TaxID=2974474 RepID=UPI0021660300|nr:DUF4270 domain-containing protein [Emticicia fluvialis]
MKLQLTKLKQALKTTTLRKRTLIFTQNSFLKNSGNFTLRMRNVAILLLSAFFLSCEDPINIAVDAPSGGGQFGTTFTDTLTVSRATVMIDSIVTSAQSGAVLGHYTDPVFGDVSATLFTQITLPIDGNTGGYAALTFPDADKDKAVYDSMYVYFAHNGFAYGDSTKPVTLNLHRLTEDFVKGKKYLNKDKLGYNATPIASKNLTYKEFKRSAASTAKDSLISFKLPASIGNEIFSIIGKDQSSDIDKFTAAIKGFALTLNNNAQTVYGISMALGSSAPVLYYHAQGDTVGKAMSLTFLGERFSEIKTNRQGKVLQNIKEFDSVPAQLTGNITYMQSGAGITTKILFPTLNNLLKAGNNNVAINKAELIIEPDMDKVAGNLRVPPQFVLVEIGKDNRLKKTNNVEDFVALDVATGTQYIADFNTTNNNYQFNFTSYLQDLLNKKKTTDGIALVPSFVSTTSSGSTIGIYNNNVSRVVIKNIKLNVYYSGKK